MPTADTSPCPWGSPSAQAHICGLQGPPSAIPALPTSSSPCSRGSGADGFHKHCLRAAAAAAPREAVPWPWATPPVPRYRGTPWCWRTSRPVPAPSLLPPPACLLCVLFVFVIYLTHQSCTRYAQQLLIPPLQPLFIGGTHWELCFMSAGNSKQTASLPHWPSSVSWSCGWRQAGVCPPAVAQNTDQAHCNNPCSSSSLPGGTGHEYKMTPMSWNARGKPKQNKSRQKPTEGTWRNRLFCRSMKDGIRSRRKQEAFYSLCRIWLSLGGQFLCVRAH